MRICGSLGSVSNSKPSACEEETCNLVNLHLLHPTNTNNHQPQQLPNNIVITTTTSPYNAKGSSYYDPYSPPPLSGGSILGHGGSVMGHGGSILGPSHGGGGKQCNVVGDSEELSSDYHHTLNMFSHLRYPSTSQIN